MKRVERVFFERLPPVKLYLEDVEEVCAIVQENAARLELETGDVALNGPLDLQRLPKNELTELEVRGIRESGGTSLSVDFERSHITLFSSKDDSVSLGTAAKVKRVLRPRQRNLVRVLLSPIFGGIPVGLFLSATVISIVGLVEGSALLSIASLVLFAQGGLFVAPIFLYSRKANLIIVKFRRDAPSFWQRRKDDLVVGLLAALVGAIIGSLLTYLLTQ